MFPVISILGIHVPVFSLFSLTALITCLFYYSFSERYSKLIYYKLIRRLFVAMIGAFIGGKTLAYIVHGRDLDGSRFMRLLNSGFVFYGALLGGIAGLWVYCKCFSGKERFVIPFLYWADMFATLLPLAQSIGRIGCFFNGCCYGRPWDHFPGIMYPVVTEGGNTIYIRVFPTWFVESLFCLLLFLVLRKMWGTNHKYYYSGMTCGKIMATYMLYYSAFRFLLEFMRGDAVRGVYFGWLSTSQIISLIVFISNSVFIKTYFPQNADCKTTEF